MLDQDPKMYYLIISEVVKFIPIAVLAVVSWMGAKIRDISNATHHLNQTASELRVWSQMHETQDDRRFDAIGNQIRHLEEKLDRLIEGKLT